MPSSLEVTELTEEEKQLIETFHQSFQDYNRRFQDEEGRKLPPDAIAALAKDYDLENIARLLEKGVVAGVKVGKRIQLVIGSNLYILQRADLFRLTDGSPVSLSKWYRTRVDEGVLEIDLEIGEEGSEEERVEKAYSSLTKYVRVVRKWHYELGYSMDELSTVRNLGVLDAYARIANEENKDVLFADAQKERSEKRAGKKANATLKIHTEQKIPLASIPPQMAEEYIQRTETKPEPETPKYPPFEVPDEWNLKIKSFVPESITVRSGQITIKGKVNN
jgi:hypothetical protein